MFFTVIGIGSNCTNPSASTVIITTFLSPLFGMPLSVWQVEALTIEDRGEG